MDKDMKRWIMLLFLIILVTNVYSDLQQKIAVLDLMGVAISESDLLKYNDNLNDFINREEGFVVINKEQRDRLLENTKYITTDCVEIECQLEIARFLDLDQIIVGGIGTLNNQYMVSLKLIEVRSEKTINAISKNYKNIEEVLYNYEDIIEELLSKDIALKESSIFKDENKNSAQASKTNSIQYGKDKLEIVYDKNNRDYFWNGEIYSYEGIVGDYTELVEDVIELYSNEAKLVELGKSYNTKMYTSKNISIVSLIGSGIGAGIFLVNGISGWQIIEPDSPVMYFSLGLMTTGVVLSGTSLIYYLFNNKPKKFIEYYDKNYPF